MSVSVRAYRLLAIWLALLVLLLVSGAAAGQPQDAPATTSSLDEFDAGTFTSGSFYMENDLFVRGAVDEDRNYTGGFGFQFNGSFVRRANLDAPLRGLDLLTRASKRHDHWKGRRYYTLLIFGTAFTPDDLRARRPVTGDRPYASLVGVSVRRLSVEPGSLDEAWSSELVVAELGTPVARNAQTWIHRRLRARSGLSTPYDPLGWHNQISDGGEPTALYRVGYERRLLGAESDDTSRKHFQLTGGLAASAGYYTNVNALTNVRVGWFTTNFWAFTPSAMIVGNQIAGGTEKRSTWELFLFGGARPKLNLYNALLQGQFRDSVYTVGIKPATLEWDLGVAAYIPLLRTQLSWNALTGRTPEFKGSTRSHNWGSIVLSYAVKTP